MTDQASTFTIAPSTLSADGTRQWCFNLPIVHPSLTVEDNKSLYYLTYSEPGCMVWKPQGSSFTPDLTASRRVLQAAAFRASLVPHYRIFSRVSLIEAVSAGSKNDVTASMHEQFRRTDKELKRKLLDPDSEVCQHLRSLGEKLVEICVSACDELSDPELLSQFEDGLSNACIFALDFEGDNEFKGDFCEICCGNDVAINISNRASGQSVVEDWDDETDEELIAEDDASDEEVEDGYVKVEL